MKTRSVAVAAGIVALAACGRSPHPTNLPRVTPPVAAAAPAAYRPASSGAQAVATLSAAQLSPSELASRFFTSPGPTNVYALLAAIDGRIDEINRRSGEEYKGCVDQQAVPYEIAVFGQTLTFYAQCWSGGGSTNPADPAFVQFGRKDGLVYLYDAHWQGRTAAVLRPIADAPGKYAVHAWIGTGYLNGVDCGATWDGCSYDVLELVADESTRAFEMTAAGIGIGYCGAQLRSDGAAIYAIGSADSCAPTATLCVAASDGVTPSSDCAAAGLDRFTLAPLGRAATPSSSGGTWPASDYPGGSANTVVLDGTAGDTLHFGPTAPAGGAGSF